MELALMEDKPTANDKIILSKNTQREMIKFFMRTSMPKLAKLGATDVAEITAPLDKEKQRTSEIQKEGC